MSIKIRHRALLAAGLASFGTAYAQTGKQQTMTSTNEIATDAIADQMPAGYRRAAARSVTVDGTNAILVRYQRADGRNATLGGEHFSAVVSADGRLMGFARMDLDLVGGALPSREESQAIAMEFLERNAHDLIPGMQISWVDTHDEPMRVDRGGRTEDVTLTGMKVKMRNRADGLWMWVIVGADRKVMVFERDIHWISFPGRRGTEKWLHDTWLAENGIEFYPA